MRAFHYSLDGRRGLVRSNTIECPHELLGSSDTHPLEAGVFRLAGSGGGIAGSEVLAEFLDALLDRASAGEDLAQLVGHLRVVADVAVASIDCEAVLRFSADSSSRV